MRLFVYAGSHIIYIDIYPLILKQWTIEKCWVSIDSLCSCLASWYKHTKPCYVLHPMAEIKFFMGGGGGAQPCPLSNFYTESKTYINSTHTNWSFKNVLFRQKVVHFLLLSLIHFSKLRVISGYCTSILAASNQTLFKHNRWNILW